METFIKKPTAWIPIVMSFAALSIVLTNVAVFGVVRQKDEGAAAHLFQILMGGQIPIIIYFLAKWLPQKPKLALISLAAQVVAIALAFAPVFYFKL